MEIFFGETKHVFLFILAFLVGKKMKICYIWQALGGKRSTVDYSEIMLILCA